MANRVINNISVTITTRVGRGKYIRSKNLKGRTGGWTKWGGGFVPAFQERVEKIWFCQSCGHRLVADLTRYLMDIDKDSFRVCAVCFFDDCPELRTRLSEDK